MPEQHSKLDREFMHSENMSFPLVVNTKHPYQAVKPLFIRLRWFSDL